MSNGTFDGFLSALLAFESGWDRDRYEAGVIQDWQLDTWAGGPVTEFFPEYSSWGDLSESEWEAMAYRSTNSLGFVGFQFGEALLIDLGYYDDDQIYGNGASTNTWDGNWTGKNGVNSLEDFMTKDAQTVAIQEAFGLNLQIIQNGLENAGQSLDDFIGQTTTYTDGSGSTVTVELTLTGILAAAHLRGAYGTLNLLQSGAVSTDEYGTSILQYIDQFGGFDSASVEDMIAFFEDRKTGDEGLGAPDGSTGNDTGSGGDGGDSAATGTGTAGVDKDSADVVLTWSYGADTQISDFDPATGTIFVDWISAADLEITETNGSVVFSVPSNQQSLTLVGVTLSELTSANFTILDATAATEILSLVGASDGNSNDGSTDGVDDNSGGSDNSSGDGSDGSSDGSGDSDGGSSGQEGNGDDPQTPTPSGSGADFDNPEITKSNADVVVTWAYGSNVIVSDFDPQSDTIFFDWIGADALDVTQESGSVVISIPSNNQTLTLQGVTLSMLSAANIHALDATARDELASLIGGGDDGHHGGGHGDGAGDSDGGDGGHSGHTHMHVTIGYDTAAQIIDGFMPRMGDVIEISANVAAADFEIFEESGDALGQTVRVAITQGGITTQTVLTGFGLEELSIANFSADNQTVLNEIASVLGTDISIPEGTEGYTLSYDADGSNPAEVTGGTDAGGRVFRADSNADDITDFDPSVDQLDFGGTSVHGMIVTKSLAGEIVIDSPWSDAAQIVQGVTYQDVSIDSFGIVGNEHFRQDMGGVISWEQNIGPREADTIYIRSHEYGRAETIENFDPASMKISFLYFGTRERLSVEDSDAGLVISSLPSGQSFTFTGVSKADLIPGLVEFHFDQVMEDNLETPFGFDQNDVTLVDRTVLLTPAAPAGATTDGYQTREGDMTGSSNNQGSTDTDGSGDNTSPDSGSDTGSSGTSTGSDTVLGSGADTIEIDWNWGATTTIEGFDPSDDMFDFNSLNDDQVAIREVDGALEIEVLNNGGNITTLSGLQAEDLTRDNFAASPNNPILDDASELMAQLSALGFDTLA
ncbi:hypothetical protein J7413_18020 [Shimia sp. R10_1]|uniref:hypothetical protein n=1 Tax=Shimia sp. R10_1 TaxID=2821095 RepID=UPI001ADA74C4|nr:hypothetical protein [Shimia sp. R10_1]MBO9475447.1 hypothetical protein [Shimia sp. R10_1]